MQKSGKTTRNQTQDLTLYHLPLANKLRIDPTQGKGAVCMKEFKQIFVYTFALIAL